MTVAVHFSSKTQEWETPIDLFTALENEFGFTLDACASHKNAKCAVYFTREDNGLEKSWPGIVWLNPPYGREIGRWIEKAGREVLNGSTVVLLIPARTDTRWWHRIVMKHEVRFLRGRLYFRDDRGNCGRAPFPSAVVVMRPAPP